MYGTDCIVLSAFSTLINGHAHESVVPLSSHQHHAPHPQQMQRRQPTDDPRMSWSTPPSASLPESHQGGTHFLSSRSSSMSSITSTGGQSFTSTVHVTPVTTPSPLVVNSKSMHKNAPAAFTLDNHHVNAHVMGRFQDL